MHYSTNYRPTRQAWLLGLVSAAFTTTSLAAAGKIEFAAGNVIALNTAGASRSLVKGTEINAGDTIQTQNGRAQLRFSDGGYISLQPNTEFKVEDYSFRGKADGSEKGFFNLVRGGLRAITGAIGHGSNKSAYRVDTPVATIGIRGTEYVAQYDTKLLVKVGDGEVYLQNGSGDLTLFKGQSGEVGAESAKPEYSDDGPSVGVAGPNGGTPEQTKNDQEKTLQNQTTFIAGDVKTDSGAPCINGSVSSGCESASQANFDMASEINARHITSSTGTYTGSSVNGSVTVSINYDINFTTYQTFLNHFDIDETAGHYYHITGSGYGSLNSSTGAHTINIVGAGINSSGCGSGSCSVNSLSGQLNSVNGLPSATVSYDATFSSSPLNGQINAHE